MRCYQRLTYVRMLWLVSGCARRHGVAVSGHMLAPHADLWCVCLFLHWTCAVL